MVEIISGNENSPLMLIKIGWSLIFSIRPSWVSEKWIGEEMALNGNVLVIRSKPAKPIAPIPVDALVGKQVIASLRDQYVRAADSMAIAFDQEISQVVSQQRNKFVSDSARSVLASKTKIDSLLNRWRVIGNTLGKPDSLLSVSRDSLKVDSVRTEDLWRKSIRQFPADSISWIGRWLEIEDSLQISSAVALRKANKERRLRFETDSTGFVVALSSLPDSLRQKLGIAFSSPSAPARVLMSSSSSAVSSDSLVVDVSDKSITPLVCKAEEGRHPAYAKRKIETTELATALKIMDEANVFDLDEAAKCFSIEVSEAIRDSFAVVPFSEATLRECASTHYLIADLGLSIGEILERKPNIFTAGWDGSNDGQILSQEDRACWKLVPRKTTGTVGKTLSEQMVALKKDYRVSSARSVVYAAVISDGGSVSGFMRTASASVYGSNRHVIIGKHNGLWLYPGYDDQSRLPYDLGKDSNQIGLAVERQ